MDKVFIVKAPFERDTLVTVYRSPIDGMFWVEQKKKVVIICNQIILKDVTFDGKQGLVQGYVSSVKEINDLHDSLGHDGNDCFPSCQIEWDLIDGFTANGEYCEWADFLDMQIGSLLAIYPEGVRLEIPSDC